MRTLVPIRPWGVTSRLLLGVDATTKASLPWPSCRNVEMLKWEIHVQNSGNSEKSSYKIHISFILGQVVKRRRDFPSPALRLPIWEGRTAHHLKTCRFFVSFRFATRKRRNSDFPFTLFLSDLFCPNVLRASATFSMLPSFIVWLSSIHVCNFFWSKVSFSWSLQQNGSLD